MITENLSTLKIHKLTQAQYNRELEAGNIDENALYLTPDEASDLGIYATKEELDEKSDVNHTHDDLYYTEIEIDEMLSYKADESHSHGISDVTNLQSSLDSKTSQLYVDEQVNAVKESLESHTDNSNIHITSENKAQLDEAHSHATSAHAPSDAEINIIVGIKKNGEDIAVDVNRKVNITVPTEASDIGAAPATHGHAISDITDLQTTLNNAANAIQTNTNSINAHTDRISALEIKVGDGFEEITSAEIQALFA